MKPNSLLPMFCFLGCLSFGQSLAASDEYVDRIDAADTQAGFFALHWEDDTGRLLLQIDQTEEPFIYQSSMARGVGSNDLGLDRGQLGATRLVRFSRTGNRVLLIEENTGYRAQSNQVVERAAVEASFARSVVWGFEVLAEQGGSVLVDATDFFIRDAHALSTRLSRAQQGRYQADPDRSVIFRPRTKAFPDNTEVEAVVTFVGERQFDASGGVVSNVLSTVVPDVTAVTVHLHHSFVRLPEEGYRPLSYDPRGGMIPGAVFLDYATPVGTPLKVSYARRHRLERSDVNASSSPAIEPIVYYVDPGAPEPVRGALIEGASWWNQAFESAGYEDAFQVRLLPEGADPMDVRYNVIQWVHRSTRGWSYGASVLDPRTGEIIKGHVTLGSLRVRQDYLIAEGLLAPYADEDIPNAMLEMALARIRQLSAHEVGHTLGLEHNFAASVNDRASVMDYPHPLIKFNQERTALDLSEAYGEGMGAWDLRTVNYAYRDFPAGVDQVLAREAILAETFASGLIYVADQDARNPGTAHPDGNLWDNGSDAMVEFEHLMAVRRFALERFDERVIRPGRPMATLEEALVPIYLLPRFQIQAVAKLIGGQRFSYALRGDGLAATQMVDGSKQLQAMTMLISALAPAELALPGDLLALIPPRPPGFGDDRERFVSSTAPVFDELAPAAAFVTLTLDVLMNPDRAARMNRFHARAGSYPGFDQLLEKLVTSTWYSEPLPGVAGSLQRQSNSLVLERLAGMARNMAADTQVRAQARWQLGRMSDWLDGRGPDRTDEAWATHYASSLARLRSLAKDPSAWPVPGTPSVPPGSPIGQADDGDWADQALRDR